MEKRKRENMKIEYGRMNEKEKYKIKKWIIDFLIDKMKDKDISGDMMSESIYLKDIIMADEEKNGK